ncbi:hypothetical protein UT300009_30810 [Paraclostridium bifermentans]
MGLFDKIFNGKNTSSNQEVYTMPTSSIVQNNNYANADSGTTQVPTIDEETALKIGALHQGISIIGDTIASLPMTLCREQDGFHEVIEDDPRSQIMYGMANDTLSAFNLKKAMIRDLILRGNAYAKIVREGKDIKLVYIPTNVITPKMDGSGFYFEVQAYSTDINGERYPAEVIDYYDMLVVTRDNQYNSITGKGLLDYANDVFATSTEESKYMYNLLVNGLSSKAILNSKSPFKREIKEQLKRDLKSFYSGANNAGKIMLLEGDVNVLPLALTPTDIKLLENKAFTISEIARFLNIPKHMLGLDRQQGTYSNITQERLQLLQNTLMPYVVLIEQAMNQKLLEDSEREQGYYFKFDTLQLMKMTPSDQADYMLKLFQADVVTIEEVRATLGLGGDAETIAQLKLIQSAKTNSAINNYGDENKSNEEKVDKKQAPVEEDTESNESDSDSEDPINKKGQKSSKEVK